MVIEIIGKFYRIINLDFNFLFFNAPVNWQLGFQKPASIQMQTIINFHQDLISYLVFLFIFVVTIFTYTIFIFMGSSSTRTSIAYKNYQNITHNTALEIIWTVLPTLLTGKLCFSSFSLIYALDYVGDPKVNIIITGNQWYWSYELHHKIPECTNPFDVYFSSYGVVDEDLKFGEFRLLEVDNALVLPVKTAISLEFISNGAVHSWAIPSLGIKVDCIPGHTSYARLFVEQPGIHYGTSCAINGTDRTFMPIKVQVLDELMWLVWILCTAEKNSDFYISLLESWLNELEAEDLRAQDSSFGTDKPKNEPIFGEKGHE